MPIAERLKEQLKLHEGVKDRLYQDTVGKWTIGVGRNLSDKPISVTVIDIMLEEDVNEVILGLDKFLPWWKQLDSVRQRVLIDLAFNMGISGLLLFKRTLTDIKNGDWVVAVQHLNESHWAEQVGDGPGGVYDRAERLSAMLLTGEDYTK